MRRTVIFLPERIAWVRVRVRVRVKVRVSVSVKGRCEGLGVGETHGHILARTHCLLGLGLLGLVLGSV